MKLKELLNITEATHASEIEACVNDLSDKTNKYRQLKTLGALKALQKTQQKIVDKLENKAA